MHKNQLYFYMLAMNDLKMKLRKQFHLKHQKIKSLGINLTKTCKTCTPKPIKNVERNSEDVNK